MTTLVEIYTTPGDLTLYPPPGATSADFEGIGGGAGGSCWVSPISPKSGGGAAYAKTTGVAVAAGTPISAHVGAGWVPSSSASFRSGDPTWVGNSSGNPSDPACLLYATPGSDLYGGGQAGNIFPVPKGTVTAKGSNGAQNTLDIGPNDPFALGSGAAGGAAGGPYGDGGALPVDGSSHLTGSGAQGGNGHGGLGGVYVQHQNGNPGANGTEIDGVHGSGGGGACAIPTDEVHGPYKGGNGGLYGGGGGVGDNSTDVNMYGFGGNGLLIVTWHYSLPAYTYCVPICVGLTYASQGQILRGVLQADGFQTGPGQGKLRRSHYAAPLMVNSQGVQMGVDFGTMRAMKFKSAGGTQDLPATSLYSGVYWEAVEGGHSYDSMWCWQVTRPYPCTVVSVEIFSEGQDNA